MALLRAFTFLFIISLLFSCNFEKRLYRSGYYVSSSNKIKNLIPQKTFSVTSPSKVASAEKEKYNPPAENKINKALYAAQAASYIPKKELMHFAEGEKKSDLQKSYFKKPIQKKNIKPSISPDDDKVKKDVKMLLLASLGSLLSALLFGIFTISGISSLIFLFYALTPFLIIGVWMYILLLHAKYAAKDEPYNQEKKSGKKTRTISQRKAFLLAGLLGIFGVHRFYLGYTKMGILEMLTLGGFFILFFIDLIRIKAGKLKPKKGDYDKVEDTYNKRGHKNKTTSKSQKLIRIALYISIVALATLFGFVLIH